MLPKYLYGTSLHTEKRKPHYVLSRVQALVQNSATRAFTSSSEDDAAKLGWGREEIVQCVLQLTHRDFYKSMTSYLNTKLWQDVYRPTFRGVDLYVKVQILLEERVVVISFKERRPGENP